MRKKEKEIKDRLDIEAVIQKAAVCRLAMSDNNVPYIVPLNFGFRDNCLYFHSSLEGRKMDIIKSNNIVCFEIDIDFELVKADKACKWSAHYKSVIGMGRAFIIDDRDKKLEALEIIMDHYQAGPHEFMENLVDKAAVVCVKVDELTGKRSV